MLIFVREFGVVGLLNHTTFLWHDDDKWAKLKYSHRCVSFSDQGCGNLLDATRYKQVNFKALGEAYVEQYTSCKWNDYDNNKLPLKL